MAWQDELSSQLTGKHPDETQVNLRLFFNFLRISPSYALMDRARAAKRLTSKTPVRTRQIIEVFRLLGEVHTESFSRWAGPALLMSGNRTSKKETLLLNQSKPFVINANCMIFSVPRTLERAQQMAQFRELLDLHDPKPVRRTVGIRPHTLWKALACVYAKARHPDKELWRIGMLANAVERFKGKVSPDGPRSLASQAEQRRHLTLMVARLILMALLISENAAIGVFPSMQKDMGVQAEFPFEAHQLHKHLSATGDEEYNLIMKSAGSEFLITT